MSLTWTVLASAMMFGGSIANAATATFGTGTDITGSVTVEAGTIDVNVDLSKMNISLLPNGTHCLTGGLRYHIHSKWNHTDSKDYLTTNCSATYTGGHYDPWTACSTSTSNDYCLVEADTYSCVLGSSSWQSGNLGYSCDETNYTSNPYVCEVGDWSGKYGYLDIDSTILTGSSHSESAWEVDGTDLEGLSIVFHCNNNDRAFCAPFEDTAADTTTDRVTQSTSTSQQAKFTDLNNSTILLENNNDYTINFDLTDLVIPEGCGDYLYYRIYNSWTEANVVVSNDTDTNDTTRRLQGNLANSTIVSLNGSTLAPVNNVNSTLEPVNNVNSTLAAVPTQAPSVPPTSKPTAAPVNCSAMVGSFYDPTVTCAPNSEKVQYCTGASNGDLCNDPSYNYDCNISDHYTCAPGDLSGKYGAIPLTTNSTSFFADSSDELMISLELLAGKSAVLQCSLSSEIVACAQFEDYSSASHSSSSGDGAATSWWVWLIVGVGALLLIGGVFWLCRYCKSDDSYKKIQN